MDVFTILGGGERVKPLLVKPLPRGILGQTCPPGKFDFRLSDSYWCILSQGNMGISPSPTATSYNILMPPSVLP